MKRVIVLLTVLLGGCLMIGCGPLTEDQVRMQGMQLQNFSNFAKENGLGLVMAANADLDGTVETRSGVKWSPVTATATGVFFNDHAVSMLRDVLQHLLGEGKLEPVVSRE